MYSLIPRSRSAGIADVEHGEDGYDEVGDDGDSGSILAIWSRSLWDGETGGVGM